MKKNGDLMNQKTRKYNYPENIKRQMFKTNTNINNLSKTIGIPFMTLKRIATGENKDPKLSLLVKIADYFNLTLEELIYSNYKEKT